MIDDLFVFPSAAGVVAVQRISRGWVAVLILRNGKHGPFEHWFRSTMVEAAMAAGISIGVACATALATTGLRIDQ